ncbi:MAG: hypothetical protein HUJ54_13730, partial [Erysipelotrichaceae bacterium]|nr:hypothetical protein [Erysipelotrichaceae bacterium]
MDETTLHLRWSVKVDVPAGGIAAGETFTDTFTPADQHYMTIDQWNEFVSYLTDIWGSENITDITQQKDDQDRIIGYSFKTAKRVIPELQSWENFKTYEWRYTTTAKVNPAQQTKFVNTISDGQREASKDYTYVPKVTGIKKMSATRGQWNWGAITEDPSEITIDYDNAAARPIVWVVEVANDKETDVFSLHDVIPAGVEVLKVGVNEQLSSWYFESPDSILVHADMPTDKEDFKISGGWNPTAMTTLEGTYQRSTSPSEGDVLDVSVYTTPGCTPTLLTKDKIYFYIICRLKESEWPKDGQPKFNAYNNTVSAYKDGSDYGTASNTINVTATKEKHNIRKGAHLDADAQVEVYTVDLNPNAETLLPGGPGTINFTDVLTYNSSGPNGTYATAALDADSAVLEQELEDGTWIPVQKVNWKVYTQPDPTKPGYTQSIIEMQVPDSTHLRFTYRYFLWSNIPEGIHLLEH